MSGEATPGRRLTEAEEQIAAGLFDAGRSEREVAEALGCSASTAHRLRLRLAGAQEPAEPADDGDGQGEPQESQEPAGDAELAALRQLHDALAEQIATTAERATASSAAWQGLEAERLRILGEGGDAVQLRDRITSARQDMDDWATAAHLLTEKLTAVDARIAEIDARGELAALRAQLDAAVAERDAVFARSGGRQRAAVAAVAAAAEEFTAVFADESAADGRVTALAQGVAQLAARFGEALPEVPAPAVTAISVSVDQTFGYGPPLALHRALARAREGRTADVAEELGKVNGWLPPGPPTEAELEERRRIAEQREQQLAELKARTAAGPGASQADDRTVPAGFDVDGVPVNRYGDRLVPRGSLPHPLDVFRYPSHGGGAYAPGYRSGW